MKQNAAPQAVYAAELLDKARANPDLFQRVMRMYEVCGSNTACVRRETQRLFREMEGRK